MKTFNRQYIHKDIETDVEKFWKRNHVVERSIQYEPGKELFSWLEGPPTANAPPGLHHVEVRVFKDLNLRYKFMQGFTVPRKGGWDCHGLPVEVQVEKKLNLPTKKDVVAYGIDKFTKMCRSDVFSYIKDWEKLTSKMAFWVDLEAPYVTMENSYIESVWWSLKELYEKGLLYEGHKVVPYCPRCETPLSSHEVALGYKEVKDPAITVRFRIPGSKRSILAWTTTPWTLPSNIALAVNPKLTYVIVSHEGEELIIAKERIMQYFDNPKIIKEMRGTDLVGTSYEPLFPYFKDKLDAKRSYKVLPADFVSIEDGTGIVHIAPAFGEDDYHAVQNSNFEFIQPVAENGHFTKDVPDFQGLFVKDADPKIIEHLEQKGSVFRKESYTHNYPFCWRCSTPLLYFATRSWFVKVSAYRERLLKTNEQIRWFPDHIKHGRFGNWLEGAKDWALSRKKFWGTPLPIWRCSCGEERAIGSVKELREMALRAPKTLDLHKPYIDKITLKCPACSKQMKRVEDVIDCWYDSGCAPFAQFHYPFENKELFEKNFPYDFITEAIDQTRGWFYTMHVISTLLFDSPAYKSCLVAGHVMDDKGEKMSKSKGNIINPWEAFEKVGVDAVRMHFLSTAPESPKRFGYESLSESTVPFLILVWNTAAFTHGFFEQHGLQGKEDAKLETEDAWLISQVNKAVVDISRHLDVHDYNQVITTLKTLAMDDFSRWYIKLVRERASDDDKALAYTLRYFFERLVRLLAPFTPYIAEKLYLHFGLGTAPSVHLARWPEPEKRDEQLESDMRAVQGIVAAALAARDKAQIGVRWPLAELIVESSHEGGEQAISRLSDLLMRQLNVKKVTHTRRFSHAKVTIAPDLGKLGPSFAKRTPKVAAAISKADPQELADALTSTGKMELDVEGEQAVVLPEHVKISFDVPKEFAMMQSDAGRVYLHIEQTPQLEAEGLARELSRRVQELRKKSGLEKRDRVSVEMVFEKIPAHLQNHKEEMAGRVGALQVALRVGSPSGKHHFESREKVKDVSVHIFLSREK